MTELQLAQHTDGVPIYPDFCAGVNDEFLEALEWQVNFDTAFINMSETELEDVAKNVISIRKQLSDDEFLMPDDDWTNDELIYAVRDAIDTVRNQRTSKQTTEKAS
jgi:hypothetical protein